MYPISIFDSTIKLLGIIDDYEYLGWSFKYRTVDSFDLKINRYKNNVEHLQHGNIIAVYINGAYRAGFVESKELRLTQDGKISETWHIGGRGLDGLMSERLAMYDTGFYFAYGAGWDVQSDIAETVMKHYVCVNCTECLDDGTGDTNRNYLLLDVKPDLLRGPNVKYDARFQSIDEILEDLSLASGLGWEITLDAVNKRYKFDVLQGLDRSWGNGVNSPVVFSPEFGNIKLLGYKSSNLDSKNVAFVAGQGEAKQREIEEVSKDDLIYTDTDRREYFIDARDLDDSDKLIQRGYERLAESGESEIVEMENLNTENYRFGYEYDSGDIVTVRYPDIVTMNARIIEVIMEITPENLMQNKIIIGRQYPDLISIMKEKDKNILPELRR